MNEESFKIIANQKRDIDYLNNYVGAWFKTICDWEQKKRTDITFLSVCVGFMGFMLYRQNKRIQKLEKQNRVEQEEDKLEKVTVE